MSHKHGISTAMIVLVFAAFVSIGLPDALFGTAWPSIRVEFEMTNASVGLLNVPGSLAYMASSAMLGTLLRKIGVARLLVGSTAMVGAGLTLYASAPSFWAFIPAVMLMAAGSGAIDAALNHFAAENLPTRYMSWLHAFYGLGALAGPFIMAIVFGMGASWRWGYAIVAMVLWLMALVFGVTRGHWHHAPQHASPAVHSQHRSGSRMLGIPRVQLSILMVMGGSIVESVASLWIVSLLIAQFDVSQSNAALGLGIYWVGLTAGRIVIPMIWPHAQPIRIQRMSTCVVIVAISMMIPGWLPATIIGIAMLGLGIASIFPVAMTLSTTRFGSETSADVVGYLVSGSTLIFAVMPILTGWLVDSSSFAVVPPVLLIGAAVLLITQLVLARGDETTSTTSGQ